MNRFIFLMCLLQHVHLATLTEPTHCYQNQQSNALRKSCLICWNKKSWCLCNINSYKNHSLNWKPFSSPLKCLNQDPWYVVASFYFGDNNNNNTTNVAAHSAWLTYERPWTILFSSWFTLNHTIYHLLCSVQFNVRDPLHDYNDLVLWQKHICITRIKFRLNI